VFGLTLGVVLPPFFCLKTPFLFTPGSFQVGFCLAKKIKYFLDFIDILITFGSQNKVKVIFEKK